MLRFSSDAQDQAKLDLYREGGSINFLADVMKYLHSAACAVSYATDQADTGLVLTSLTDVNLFDIAAFSVQCSRNSAYHGVLWRKEPQYSGRTGAIICLQHSVVLCVYAHMRRTKSPQNILMMVLKIWVLSVRICFKVLRMRIFYVDIHVSNVIIQGCTYEFLYVKDTLLIIQYKIGYQIRMRGFSVEKFDVKTRNEFFRTTKL